MFDVDKALRWARFDPERTLARRPDELLYLPDAGTRTGRELLFDTCVYIDTMQGRFPVKALDALKLRARLHSTVAIQELMHASGRLDPSHPGTNVIIAQIKRAIKDMPEHRIHTPDADVLGRAALLAGILCRLQGYQKDQKFRALNDCVLYLQAVKLGVTVLTANVADFDYLLQLVPAGKVLFYRPDTPAAKS